MILVVYLSSVDVPFGTSVIELGWQRCFLTSSIIQNFLILLCQTPAVSNSLEKANCVVPYLILRHLYSVPVCKSLLQCVAHFKSQELNDELSVWSQISTWLPLVCIKSQQGVKWQLCPNRKFCANPHFLIPLPTISYMSP